VAVLHSSVRGVGGHDAILYRWRVRVLRWKGECGCRECRGGRSGGQAECPRPHSDGHVSLEAMTVVSGVGLNGARAGSERRFGVTVRTIA